MWFVKDLADGKEFEHRMLEIATQEFPWETWESNKLIKWVDIVGSGGHTIEVKFDRLAATTWNLFIEVECNGKPSWINAYEDITIYSYWVGNSIYLFNAERLKRAIQNIKFRKIKGGDWWRVTWILIPIKVGAQLASKIINPWQ